MDWEQIWRGGVGVDEDLSTVRNVRTMATHNSSLTARIQRCIHKSSSLLGQDCWKGSLSSRERPRL